MNFIYHISFLLFLIFHVFQFCFHVLLIFFFSFQNSSSLNEFAITSQNTPIKNRMAFSSFSYLKQQQQRLETNSPFTFCPFWWNKCGRTSMFLPTPKGQNKTKERRRKKRKGEKVRKSSKQLKNWKVPKKKGFLPSDFHLIVNSFSIHFCWFNYHWNW